MAGTMKRPHRAAVTRMLRATGLAHVPEEAPLVQLVRSLADEMDNGGGARTQGAYLSALKDVRRFLNTSQGRPKASPDVPTSEPEGGEELEGEARQPTSLATFKQARGIA